MANVMVLLGLGSGKHRLSVVFKAMLEGQLEGMLDSQLEGQEMGVSTIRD
jgi:hypothetical protein